MRTSACVLFGVFLVGLVRAQRQGFYQVIGPKTIRPNSDFHCAISIENTSEPTTVTTNIQGFSKNGSQFNVDNILVVQPYTTKISRLEIPDIEPGDYKLQVRGVGGHEFLSYYPLEFLEKSYSVFIQTDRSVYKPGSKINFRAIVLNSNLKPAAEVRREFLTIEILDGKDNVVKKWRRVEAVRGVFTEEVKLGKNPVLGNWKIAVTIHGQTFNKSIEVAENILPKFMVNIDTKKHVTFREGRIITKIEALYNYGKSVEGEATVTIYPTIFSTVIQPIFQNPVRKVVPIKGTTTVEFDIDSDLKLNDEYERGVIVDVTIEEALTGRRQNNSAEVHIHKYDYKLDLIKSGDYFKPGLKYVAYVKVTNNDGTPLSNGRNEVTVRHGFSRQDEIYVETQHTLNKNGIVTLEYLTPKEVTNITALRIEVEYQDLKERISPIPAAVSYGNTFLQATLETDRPIVNLDVEISVNSTEPMKYLNYVLIGRGDVIIGNTFQIDNRKEYQFHFTATHAMVPVSHLIVYYVNDQGELIGDSLDIEIDGLLQNFIDIQTNTFESDPNLDVEFTIRAQPNSYIGLLAIDQKLLSLKNNNFDLSHKQISADLKRYDSAKQSPYAFIEKDAKTHFSWRPGSSNPHSAIYESGADLLTNAHVNRHKPTLEDIYLRPVFYGTATIKPDRGFALPIHTATRPPLAGPYAFSRIPKPVWNTPKIYLTEDIADTWLFANFSAGYDGKTSIRRRLPSSLNTWVITGFSLDPLHGLGLITTPKTVKVSKQFVVSIDLPYAVQRGEILAVPVVVYNNLNQDISCDVTLHNPEHKFDFSEVSNDLNGTKRIELYRRKKLNVKANSGASVTFMISPKNEGLTEIKVTASSSKNQDVVVKNLQVKAEGEREFYTKSVLIDLRKTQNYAGRINFTLPKNVVQGTEKIEAESFGDLLGPTLINLENLINLPSDSGEANMVHFMPNIIILKHLMASRQDTPSIYNKAIQILEESYQEQLSFRRKDGSFSAFGDKDASPSVWLTAYVAQAFSQGKEFIFIDENILDQSLEWLMNNQGRNGSFVEFGTVIHSQMQNMDLNSLALTAFVLLSFMEHKSQKYTNTINKGLDYIARNLDESESTYALAICAYALQIAKHPSKQNAFNLLDSRAKVTSKDKKFWTVRNLNPQEIKNPWNTLPNSIDIETTSYALLTFLEMNLLEDAIPVLNWLLEQENGLGGFTSSQDTVIGLVALAKLVRKLSVPTNMQIEFAFRKQESGRFSVNKNNALIVQKLELQSDVRDVNITAQGSGLAVFRITYSYNMNVTGPWPLFTLDPQVDKNSNRDHLQISICTAYVSRNLSETQISNMAVMEVNLPSGFTADIDSLPSLEVSQNVQRVETDNGLTKVVLYFNNITRNFEYCPTVSAFRTHKVAKQKSAAVVVYDYYDSSRRARMFYKGRISTLCDICENEDCGNICTSIADPRVGGQEGDSPREGRSKNGSFQLVSNYVYIIFTIFVSLNIFKF